MRQLLLISLSLAPFLATISFTATRKYGRAGLYLLGWLCCLLLLAASKQVPPLSQWFVAAIAFSFPLWAIWSTGDWIRGYTQKINWLLTALWSAGWYLLIDPTGVGLISWIIAWPVIGWMLMKFHNPDRKFPRLFRHST